MAGTEDSGGVRLTSTTGASSGSRSRRTVSGILGAASSRASQRDRASRAISASSPGRSAVSATSTRCSAASAAATAPRRTCWNTGLARSGTTSATVRVRPSDRLRPRSLGRYLSSSATARTRAAMSGATVVRRFITLDTVAWETPAAAATWLMVAPPRELPPLDALVTPTD